MGKHVCPFANHGTLTLHAELSEQENTESLKKSQVSIRRKECEVRNITSCHKWKCEVRHLRSARRDERRCNNGHSCRQCTARMPGAKGMRLANKVQRMQFLKLNAVNKEIRNLPNSSVSTSFVAAKLSIFLNKQCLLHKFIKKCHIFILFRNEDTRFINLQTRYFLGIASNHTDGTTSNSMMVPLRQYYHLRYLLCWV